MEAFLVLAKKLRGATLSAGSFPVSFSRSLLFSVDHRSNSAHSQLIAFNGFDWKLLDYSSN